MKEIRKRTKGENYSSIRCDSGNMWSRTRDSTGEAPRMLLS